MSSHQKRQRVRRAQGFVTPEMVTAHYVLCTREEMAEQFECGLSTVEVRVKEARQLGLRPTIGKDCIEVQRPAGNAPRIPYVLELPSPSAKVVVRMRRWFTVPQIAYGLDITACRVLRYQAEGQRDGRRLQPVKVARSKTVLIPDDQLVEVCATRSLEAVAAELDFTVSAVREQLGHATKRGYHAADKGGGVIAVMKHGVDIEMHRSWEEWAAAGPVAFRVAPT